jgi:hypothetical protein
MIHEDPRQALAYHFMSSRFVAHETIFASRRDCSSSPMHMDMLGMQYSDIDKVLLMAFRGSAKTTLAEEVLTLAPIINFPTNPAHNFLIIGSNETRAAERLEAVKHELQTNEALLQTFGDYKGDTWTNTRITLKNNVCIQALGQDQSMRGTKYLSWRPDFILLDDIEEEEHVATPEARLKFLRRFLAKILPAFARNCRVRMNATPLDAEALAVTLSNSPEWTTKVYPIKYMDPATGQWKATWETAFPMERIDKIERDLASKGQLAIFEREYMMMAAAVHDALFKDENLVYEPRPRTFQAIYAMYDPARSINKNSAHTGKAVWSWENNKLLVWEAGGHFWKPDEIIKDALQTSEKYDPVLVGFEEDGLNEFLMQPLRAAATKVEHPFPFCPVKAPRSKIDFIRGLQPFHAAKEIIFVGEPSQFETLVAQLKNFPTGRIDAPNALAYALMLRPGLPVFEGFPLTAIISESLQPSRARPLMLAVHASKTSQQLVGAVCQFGAEGLTVYADYAFEGTPGLRLAGLLQAASFDFGRRLQVIAPPLHFQPYDVIGLRAAAASIPVEIEKGGQPQAGREALRQMLERLNPATGRPRLAVRENAHWTLRGFAGGYHYDMNGPKGQLRPEPKSNIYAVVLGALESIAARSGLAMSDSQTYERHYAEDAYGRQYLTSRPVG